MSVSALEHIAMSMFEADTPPFPTDAVNPLWNRDWPLFRSSYLARARKLLERMRAVPELCYDHYRCDKLWRDMNSTEVWNLWIDAALKEDR